jgi:hypothetical protein
MGPNEGVDARGEVYFAADQGFEVFVPSEKFPAWGTSGKKFDQHIHVASFGIEIGAEVLPVETATVTAAVHPLAAT